MTEHHTARTSGGRGTKTAGGSRSTKTSGGRSVKASGVPIGRYVAKRNTSAKA